MPRTLIAVSLTPAGEEVRLTLTLPDSATSTVLATGLAETRLRRLLDTEAERASQIVGVAIADHAEAQAIASLNAEGKGAHSRRTLEVVEIGVRGPDQIAGPDGGIVVPGTGDPSHPDYVPLPEVKDKGDKGGSSGGRKGVTRG